MDQGRTAGIGMQRTAALDLLRRHQFGPRRAAGNDQRDVRVNVIVRAQAAHIGLRHVPEKRAGGVGLVPRIGQAKHIKGLPAQRL